MKARAGVTAATQGGSAKFVRIRTELLPNFSHTIVRTEKV